MCWRCNAGGSDRARVPIQEDAKSRNTRPAMRIHPSSIPSYDLQTGWPPTTFEEDLTVFRHTLAVLEPALRFTGELVPADMSATAPQPSGRPPKKEPEWADARQGSAPASLLIVI